MLFTWNEQSIKWFLDASSYTGFHKTLAGILLPYLNRNDTLFDAGCGLGRLDLELAPHVKEITAVDMSESAAEALRHDIIASGLDNVHIRRGDASEQNGYFDAVILSFFGQTDMLEYLERCRRRLIRIVSAGNHSSLYPQQYRRNYKDTVPIVQSELEAQDIRYKLELHSIEFGQPLCSWRDAELYILKNAPEADTDEVNSFLRKNLENTGRDDFPYYLPNKKELGIFIIDRETNK